jgi:hypothetical protein
MPAFPSTFGSDCSGQYFPLHIVTIEVQVPVERGQAVTFMGVPHDGSVPAASGAAQWLGLAMNDCKQFDLDTGLFTPKAVAVVREGSFTARCKDAFSPGDYVWSDAAGFAIQGTPALHYGQAYGFAQAGGMLEVLLGKACAGQ